MTAVRIGRTPVDPASETRGASCSVLLTCHSTAGARQMQCGVAGGWSGARILGVPTWLTRVVARRAYAVRHGSVVRVPRTTGGGRVIYMISRLRLQDSVGTVHGSSFLHCLFLRGRRGPSCLFLSAEHRVRTEERNGICTRHRTEHRHAEQLALTRCRDIAHIYLHDIRRIVSVHVTRK